MEHYFENTKMLHKALVYHLQMNGKVEKLNGISTYIKLYLYIVSECIQ